MAFGRKENRESADKKFRDACRGAGLSEAEKHAFGRYCHEKNALRDYMSYGEIKRLAEEWKRAKGYNPYA